MSSVVIASVAMERLASVIKFSMSRLHVLSACGWLIAILLSVRTAAKRSVGLGELRKSCSTETAGASSRALTFLMLMIARAAS